MITRLKLYIDKKYSFIMTKFYYTEDEQSVIGAY